MGVSFDMMNRDTGQYLDVIAPSITHLGNCCRISEVMVSARHLAVVHASNSSTGLVMTVALPA